MSDTVRQKAKESKSLVDEVAAIELREPDSDIIPLEQADAPLGEREN